MTEPSARARISEYICSRFTCSNVDCLDCEPDSVALEHADTILALILRAPPAQGEPEEPRDEFGQTASEVYSPDIVGASEAISPTDLVEVLENVRAGISELHSRNKPVPMHLHRACQALAHMTKGSA